MLGVVEDEERPPADEPRFHARRQVAPSFFLHRKCLRHRRHEQVRVSQGRQRNPPEPVGERLCSLRCGVDREPGLPRASWPRERQQSGTVLQQRRDLGDLALAAEERRRRHREVRAVQRLERRKRRGS